MKMIKVTNTYKYRFTEIEVERFTDNSVWINGRRRARKSSYENYFETMEAAKKWVKNKLMGDIQRLQWHIVDSEESIDRIKAELKSLEISES